MEEQNIYHHLVQYRWTTKRGNALTHHYVDDYAISRYADLEYLNLDNVNYSMAVKRLGLLNKNLHDFKIVKIYESKVVGQHQ